MNILMGGGERFQHSYRMDEHFCISSGVRHFAALQLIGVGDKASGSVQLFPLNGELMVS